MVLFILGPGPGLDCIHFESGSSFYLFSMEPSPDFINYESRSESGC